MAEENRKAESNHLDPWFAHDGNVVLAAQGKYFRVHRGVLSTYSEVFKGMFDCPVPSEGPEQEYIENCPVVHLHDAAVDVQMMLKAMYDRRYPVPTHKKAPLPVISAFLRLGKKYIIPQLLNEATERLGFEYNGLDVATQITASKSRALQLFPRITDNDPHNFQIMNLLQDLDFRAPLPSTMFQCVISCPLITILDGYKFKDTTYTLSPENMRAAMLLKDVLETFRTRLAQSLPMCRTNSAACMSNLLRLMSNEPTLKYPFSVWKREWDEGLCIFCKMDAKTKFEAANQDARNKIPRIFGFDSWTEVAKSDDYPSSDGESEDQCND